MRKLPQGLKLGVATASFQIEGAWDTADKTPHIWDTLCHNHPEYIRDKTNADDACKSYEFYERDIEMLKFIGVDFYRFSISWPRILPTGYANKISETGYEYYNNLINKLLANNIEPVVTIYHWDLPQNLQDLGGWANPLIVDWFGDYAKVLYKLYGDRVKSWITINEPKQFGVFGYGMNRFAPRINATGVGEYLAAKNIVLAHARAWHIYDKEFRGMQKGECGITIATDFHNAVSDSPEDVEAGLDAIEFEVGLYSHPIFSSKGGFPDRVVKLVAAKSAEQGFPRSRLPEFTPEEIEYAKGTSDFYGFNHYSTRYYTRSTYTSGSKPIPSYADDLGADFNYLDYEPSAIPHVTAIPHGIRKALKWVKDNCNDPPIFITENGFGTIGGGLRDPERISYHRKYLDNVLDAIEQDGCNVVRYTAWSLMDNFEWDRGLSAKFGLFEVDFDDKNKKRTARTSALWYKKLIATRTLDSNNTSIPELEERVF
ncbi:myrosinase 1-like [Maniola hyperantus]|uniref:myrosinase 1-like n=1 Tax=Aphantopus hyperantus TaxID=2795564 RepID=UPI0015685784|nr:myrosinase 1-like [Maniola hyperantus]